MRNALLVLLLLAVLIACNGMPTPEPQVAYHGCDLCASVADCWDGWTCEIVDYRWGADGAMEPLRICLPPCLPGETSCIRRAVVQNHCVMFDLRREKCR